MIDDPARFANDPQGLTEEITPLIRALFSRMLDAREGVRRGIDGDDICQEVFLRLFKDDSRLLRSFDPGRARFSTWLTIVARSTILDILRRRTLDTVSFQPDLHEPAAPVEKESVFPVIPAELLTPRQSAVLTLLYERELSVEESSRILGVTAQTIRSARHKAIGRLRKFFNKKDHSGDREADHDV